MDFTIIFYISGFCVAALFTIATIIWWKINNENPTLYKCRHALNYILLIAFIFMVRAFRIIPDPQSIRLMLQHLLLALVALGFFFEIKRIYKKNLIKRKKELEQVINLDVENPLKDELSREVIKPELKKLEGLRNLIQNENKILEQKKAKLEKWEDKLEDLNNELTLEKRKLIQLNKELKAKEKELKNMDVSLENRKRKVEQKEKNYRKKEDKLKKKRDEIKKISSMIEDEKRNIEKKIKKLKLIEADIKDQKEDIKREQKKLKELKK